MNDSEEQELIKTLHSFEIEDKLKPLLESSLVEANKCLEHSALASIVLCVALLEGLLRGIAEKNPENFNKSEPTSQDSQRKIKKFREWNFEDFINVAVKLELISKSMRKRIRFLQDYRNCIHLHEIIQNDNKLNIDKNTAIMFIDTTKDVINDLFSKVEEKYSPYIPNDLLKNSTLANSLALTSFVGAWDEKNNDDIKAINSLLKEQQETWTKDIKKILHESTNILSLKNGIWVYTQRVKLLNKVGSYVVDQDLENFQDLAIPILKEIDPAFELPLEQRYMASIGGKTLRRSKHLRKGIVEGLALLGNNSDKFSKCLRRKAEHTALFTMRAVFEGADWKLWGSLSDLLPIFAEASPKEFLRIVDRTLLKTPGLFKQLFTQESNNMVTCKPYMAGLLWALEQLAWEEEYFVDACMALGALANIDPGGNWSNRPFNSLVNILLPWFPLTLASVEKRAVAIQSLGAEYPEITLDLIIKLLPGEVQNSFGSRKPVWRKSASAVNEQMTRLNKGVNKQEYGKQVASYANYAVQLAGTHPQRLSKLIKHSEPLPEQELDALIETISSLSISEFSDDGQLLIWGSLRELAFKHKKYPTEQWSFSKERIALIEHLATQLEPIELMQRYQYLFCEKYDELFEEDGNWDAQMKKLNNKQEQAIKEIIGNGNLEQMMQFADSVQNPWEVGYALAAIPEKHIEMKLLPDYLDSGNRSDQLLTKAFVFRKHKDNDWAWCDEIDKSNWSVKQQGLFLSYLPFESETWKRVEKWLGRNQCEYWINAEARISKITDGVQSAIDKLIECGKSYSAIECLYTMHSIHKIPISVDQCIRALKQSNEIIDAYSVVKIINFLQSQDVSKNDLAQIEWRYLDVLEHATDGSYPKALAYWIATDPNFFCELIRCMHLKTEPSEEEKSMGEKAIKLLVLNDWETWKTCPGTQEDGSFNTENFNEWLGQVKSISENLELLNESLGYVGRMLIDAPEDPDGLWMHKTVAEALNAPDAERLREGYRMGEYNSRGCYWVNQSGKQEEELAEKYRQRSEEIEDAGFHRLAAFLRELASQYTEEADQVREQFGNSDEE